MSVLFDDSSVVKMSTLLSQASTFTYSMWSKWLLYTLLILNGALKGKWTIDATQLDKIFCSSAQIAIANWVTGHPLFFCVLMCATQCYLIRFSFCIFLSRFLLLVFPLPLSLHPPSSLSLSLVLSSEDEERLVRDLFRDYNKLIRPVEVMNMTVEVQFGLNFIQLINVVSV